MAAETFFYDTFYALQWAGLNLNTQTVKVLLVTSDYTFDASHESMAEILTSPSPEVPQVDSPSNGYTTGGKTLTGTGISVSASPKMTVFEADDVEWNPLTATFRGAIYYIDGEVDGITDPPLFYLMPDNTPADVVISGTNYKLEHSAGVMTSA